MVSGCLLGKAIGSLKTFDQSASDGAAVRQHFGKQQNPIEYAIEQQAVATPF
jgi:hypothetical protein